MPRKNKPIPTPAELIWHLLIGFNLVFQGMALPLHLHVSHFQEETATFSREIPHFRADDSHEHEDCPICRALTALHNPLAGNFQNPFVFFPFHCEDLFFSIGCLTGDPPRQYDPRAPPAKPELAA